MDAEEMVAVYKHSEEEIKRIDSDKDGMEQNLRKQMQNGLKDFDKRIAVIRAEKKAYKENMEDHMASIMIDFKNEKKQFFDEIGKVEKLIGILNGKLLRKVSKIKEGDFRVHNCDVRYYDEFYDSNFMSLRAIIVECEGVYGLYVVGCSENGNYRYGKMPVMVMSLVGDSLVPITVNCHIEDGDDLDDLIKFYEECVKTSDYESDECRYLEDMVMTESHIHEENKVIKHNSNLDDFEEILGCRCYECGKSALTKRYIEQHRGIVGIPCWHCGSEMVWY